MHDNTGSPRSDGALPRVGSRSDWRWLTHALMLLLVLAGPLACGGKSVSPRLTLRLLTGAENRDLDPVIQRFAKQENVAIVSTYQGSVDTMLDLQQGAAGYDAVWPASSIWISLGDTGGVVTRTQSIMRTPVVFALKRSVAERLGWVGRDVKVEEILTAAEAGQLRYMMTSATQSNSGAMAYLGYLYAFAGHPDVLTTKMLHDPAVIQQTKRILGSVNRSAGASGFLRDLFLKEYDHYDGMVNNESAVITANRQLTTDGREPLYVIYPVDGLAIADWPLGYVDHGDAAESALFDKFQAFLLSDGVRDALLAAGRRVGPIGINPAGADPKVFNPDWGIDLTRVIQPITPPAPDVIREALVLYQTTFRKPSLTVYCIDFSGSISGKGVEGVKSAMRVLLDSDQASRYLLQGTPGDITIVIPFNDHLLGKWRTDGNDPVALRELLAKVSAQETGGGTNIYDPVIAGLDAMAGITMANYLPAIIVMTDGRSDGGSFNTLRARLGQASPGLAPVYAILFGDASEDQLQQITDATSGRIFDGRTDLIDAFRQSKANN